MYHFFNSSYFINFLPLGSILPVIIALCSFAIHFRTDKHLVAYPCFSLPSSTLILFKTISLSLISNSTHTTGSPHQNTFSNSHNGLQVNMSLILCFNSFISLVYSYRLLVSTDFKGY